MHYKLKSVKLTILLLFNFQFILLLWFNKLTVDAYVSLTTILLLSYFGANVATKKLSPTLKTNINKELK